MAALNPKDFTKIYLNGEYVDCKSPMGILSLSNPKDNSFVVDGIPIAGAEDVDLAVKYAEEAFNGLWGEFTALQKTQCFHRLAGLLQEQLISIITLDSLTSDIPISIIPIRERNYIINCVL